MTTTVSHVSTFTTIPKREQLLFLARCWIEDYASYIGGYSPAHADLALEMLNDLDRLDREMARPQGASVRTTRRVIRHIDAWLAEIDTMRADVTACIADLRSQAYDDAA